MAHNLRYTEFLNNSLYLLCGTIILSALFLPPIPFTDQLAIEVSDILIPISAFVVLLNWKVLEQKKFMLLLFAFALLIFISIFINDLLQHLSGYFEIYKLGKFGVLIFLFSLIHPNVFYKNWIQPIFIVLVIVNLIQYFNLFHFNNFLEEFYFGNGNYTMFGLNSAGIPISKRMLGLAANPNNNAIIFSVFAILFTPKKDSTTRIYWFFSIAIIMMFLCQSRTTMLAMPVVLIAYALLNFTSKKMLVVTLGCAFVSAAVGLTITEKTVGLGTPINMQMVKNYEKKYPYLHWDDTQKRFLDSHYTDGIAPVNEDTYLESVGEDELIEGTSMKGRYETWTILWQMIKKKPIFGHGPYKEFFYSNKLYAENEYIYTAWKYGFFGLILFLGIFLSLILKAYKNKSFNSSLNLIMVLTLFATTALTNLPFSSTTLNVLLAMVIGLNFAELRHIAARTEVNQPAKIES